VFIYAGFLITDNLFLVKMKGDIGEDKYKIIREYFMKYVRKVVPISLVVAVLSGGYLIYVNFGDINDGSLSNFQILLSIKAFLGSWLGFRGIAQSFFGINPLVFKSHLLPFAFTIIIIFLSQVMFSLN
jgi:hypothetical protein